MKTLSIPLSLWLLASTRCILSAAQTGITLQTYDSMGCEGNVITNVRSIPGAPKDSSGCVALNQFQSVGVLNANPGFQCNIYSDPTCQNFMTTFKAGGVCTNIIATGVICFNQGLFDNPFAASTAQVQVGTRIVTVDRDGGFLTRSAAIQACGNSGCDPTNPSTKPWSHFNKDCTQSISMSGNYDNTDQRDYMVGILAQAMSSGTTNTRADLRGSAADDNVVRDVPSFIQVVINDQNGNNQAQMTVTPSVECSPPSDGNCNGLLGQITSAVLGSVPSVGGLLALGFEITCANT
ncbi:hypothetical protein Dda_4412 [Drechslerella dactyloides]|uniref:Uncharacterized protein n=1 Tax=Drechslerella dactyloides TaxID=74499 RepID=A0AAD6IWZ0_DREDA|nr:hypothetical protein Dda_4412 [Drechslerella dactyloides]